METFIYNLYLLYCINLELEFDIIDIQTNNTLIITNKAFAIYKEK